MKVEPALVNELKTQFDSIAFGEPRQLPVQKVRELVLSTYLAPQEVVDKFIAVIDDVRGSGLPQLLTVLFASGEERLRCDHPDHRGVQVRDCSRNRS